MASFYELESKLLKGGYRGLYRGAQSGLGVETIAHMNILEGL